MSVRLPQPSGSPQRHHICPPHQKAPTTSSQLHRGRSTAEYYGPGVQSMPGKSAKVPGPMRSQPLSSRFLRPVPDRLCACRRHGRGVSWREFRAGEQESVVSKREAQEQGRRAADLPDPGMISAESAIIFRVVRVVRGYNSSKLQQVSSNGPCWWGYGDCEEPMKNFLNREIREPREGKPRRWSSLRTRPSNRSVPSFGGRQRPRHRPQHTWNCPRLDHFSRSSRISRLQFFNTPTGFIQRPMLVGIWRPRRANEGVSEPRNTRTTRRRAPPLEQSRDTAQ